MVNTNTFTAYLYNECNEAVDFESFTCVEDAIACAQDNNWDEVVNDNTGDIVWKNN